MRWLIFFLSAPVVAGDFGVFLDAWVDEDRGESVGLEYVHDGDWKPTARLGAYENYWGGSSWYAGLGVQKSLWGNGTWDVSAGLSALYFDHGWSDAETSDNGVAIQTIRRNYARTDYWSPSPALRAAYGNFGVTLAAFDSPDEETTTALQLSYTF